MDTITTTDHKRAQVHAMWAAVVPAWGEYADDVDARGAAMTQRMLSEAHLARGHRVLELASGPGGAGLQAAAMVGDAGHVVISDVVADMVAIAASRARALRLGNVTTTVFDLEAIDQPDNTLHPVICREGLMFAVDPITAAGEIRRVLRPGGRVALSVWGAPAANPWLNVVFDAIAAVTGQRLPPPGMP